ncbi:L-threonylcarbamoyladenylate synthase [Petrachloros mirabilis]
MSAIEPYSSADLPRISTRVKAIIQRGGVIAIPTETYYGLAVDPFNERAIERLMQIKERDKGKPLLVVIGALSQLSSLVKMVPPAAEILINNCWPGALTILFPAKEGLPDNLTAGTGTIGVRLSSMKPLVELLQLVGPLTGTSANQAGRPPAQTARMVEEELGCDIDLIIDAGPTTGGLPSTVIDAHGPVRVVREGAVTKDRLQQVLRAENIELV